MEDTVERGAVDPGEWNSSRSDETRTSDPRYGTTITKQIEKEKKEKEHNLNGFPDLLTTEMKVIIGLCEVMIVITLVTGYLWGFYFGGLSTDLHRFGGTRLCVHVAIFVIVDVVLIPHIIIGHILLDRVNPSLKFIAMIMLKLTIFAISISFTAETYLFVQTRESKSDPTDEEKTKALPSTIYNTHHTVVAMMSIVEIVYIVTTVSNFLTKTFPALFDIRIIGRILSIISRPWFTEPLEELFIISGCFGILSGFHSYMSYTWNKVSLVESHDNNQNNFLEGIAIGAIIICVTILCSLVIQANRLSHFLRNHKNQITEKIFIDDFLQFKDVFQGDVILREEDPKIDPVHADRMN